MKFYISTSKEILRERIASSFFLSTMNFGAFNQSLKLKERSSCLQWQEQKLYFNGSQDNKEKKFVLYF